MIRVHLIYINFKLSTRTFFFFLRLEACPYEIDADQTGLIWFWIKFELISIYWIASNFIENLYPTISTWALLRGVTYFNLPLLHSGRAVHWLNSSLSIPYLPILNYPCFCYCMDSVRAPPEVEPLSQAPHLGRVRSLRARFVIVWRFPCRWVLRLLQFS